MIWKIQNQNLDLSSRALVMGILNVTLDSFSDGGKFLDIDRAAEHALAMAADGADIIDVGGESTGPGAEPVAEKEEMRRVLPVVERLKAEGERLNISIDTSKPAVARAAIERGASIINDVTGLRDPAMIEVARETGAGV